MPATYEKEGHSRTSSQTNVPDLEKGEASLEREEDEVVPQDQVCAQKQRALARQLTLCRSRKRVEMRLVQLLRSTCHERARGRIN
jgi:hypothetical protein